MIFNNMKLIVVGDSFVEGLIKLPNENTFENRKKINFATKLGDLLNMEVINLGQRGAGSHYISHSIVSYIQNNPNDEYFVLVVWSGAGRCWNYDVVERKYSPDTIRKSECYETYDELMFLNHMFVRGVHDFLKSKNIPHLMTNSYEDFKHISDLGLSIDDMLPYWIEWTSDSNTLYNIISENFLNPTDGLFGHIDEFKSPPNSKYITECYHPSDDGHTLIAKTLIPYIKSKLVI